MSTELNPDVINVAGKAIPLAIWGIAKQLDAVLTRSELTPAQMLALAVNAGVEHAKKTYTPQFEEELRATRNEADKVVDHLTKLLRNM